MIVFITAGEHRIGKNKLESASAPVDSWFCSRSRLLADQSNSKYRKILQRIFRSHYNSAFAFYRRKTNANTGGRKAPVSRATAPVSRAKVKPPTKMVELASKVMVKTKHLQKKKRGLLRIAERGPHITDHMVHIVPSRGTRPRGGGSRTRPSPSGC